MSKNKNQVTKEQASTTPKYQSTIYLIESLSVDIKLMSKEFGDFIYLLVIICKITNSILAIPIKSRTAQVITEALIHRPIYIFEPPNP